MGFLAVIVAALASYGFGAVWYMVLQKQWVAASGLTLDDKNQPVGTTKYTYVLAGLAMLLVAGMMRHTFALSGIDRLGEGLVSGLGIGLFFISPWIMLNNAFGIRPFRLTLIDGGYATIGCAIMGSVLTLF